MTAALSAICGAHFGEAKDAASTLTAPASASRLTSSIFVAAGIRPFSFCRPSRGATSTIFTLGGICITVSLNDGAILTYSLRDAARFRPINGPQYFLVQAW